MFRPAPMQRLGVVVLHRDEHAVLHGLGDLGAVHLVRQPSGPETAPHEPPDRTVEMARCGDLLTRIETVQSRLEIAALPPPSAALAEMRLDEAARCLKTLEARASEVLGRRQTVQERWGQATDLLAQAAAYEGLGLPMHEFGGASFLHFATGSLPGENLEDLQKQLGDNVVLLALPEREGRRHVIAVTSRKGRYALDTSLGRVGFRQDALTLAEGESVDHFAGRTRAERDQAAGELDDAAGKVRAIAQDLAPVLADLQYLVSTERMILEAEQNFPRTESTVLISGWVPAADAVGVHRRLLEITSGRCAIESADPRGVPDQEIPVLLRHSRLVRPFLMLLENYGLPTYREIEPTLIMAVSWVIMFGMMFGDAGNGAVVALVGAWLMIKGRTLTMRDGGLLLLLAGLSSVGFGIFYGSYFGITEAGGKELGHDPLKGFAIHLMLAAVALGILLMSIGLALNIINRLRRGDVLGALLDKFGVAGVAFYWGCLGIGGYVAMRGAGPPWWAVLLIIGTPLMAVALRAPLHVLMARRRGEHEVGRAVGSLSEAVIEAFVEVFEAILGYTANTISFVRLAAYAMSHAAVLMASFAVGDQFAHGVPGGGGEVLRIVFIVLGNAVAILLEGLVASVQALRLEYYEFFGKFFSGAGQAFKPFRLPAR